ncbi:FAD-binding protein [Streptomyces graminilatus]|uniref:FAD-binding protein n=1 Tax=Streptomyces graminilatus TaxID=1464070 RepID=UPI0006E43A53|nr:FAD-binding protein [Streptomyces graminilatus]
MPVNPVNPLSKNGRRRASGASAAGELPAHAATVVVGGGLAGLELATALAENGARDVLLLESGPGDDLVHIHRSLPQDRATEAVFAPENDPWFHRPWESDSAHYTGISGLRRRLGGRSLYWHGVVLPLEDWALSAPWWPSDVVADLTKSWRGGPSLYESVGDDLRKWSSPAPGSPERAGAFGGHDFRPLPRACRYLSDGRWEAYTPLARWPRADEVPRPPVGVRVRCDTEVLGVHVRDGAARGVLVRDSGGARALVTADAVVLSAGTVESTRLAVQALSGHGALPEPRLGGLADHIVQGFVVRLPARATAAGRVPGPGSYYVPADPVSRSYLRLDVRETEPGELLLDVRVTGEQLPNVDSAVECVPATELPWRTRIRAALLPQDHELVAAQREMLRGFWRRLAEELELPFTPMEFTAYGDPSRDNTQVLPSRTRSQAVGVPETWTSLLGTEDHEGGSLPLGQVLTSRQEFTDLPGLYAAGPVVFPRLGAANPSLTTLALSRRLAAILAGAE